MKSYCFKEHHKPLLSSDSQGLNHFIVYKKATTLLFNQKLNQTHHREEEQLQTMRPDSAWMEMFRLSFAFSLD